MLKNLTSLLAVAALWSGIAAAGTLDDVRDRRELNCGVSQNSLGFSAKDENGVRRGFDVDLCRAVAAAVLGDPNAVHFVPLTSSSRFPSLVSGEIDLLVRTTTHTLYRDAGIGVSFVGVNYYDGQGLLVPKSLGVTSAMQLDGAPICVISGTTTELNLFDFFNRNNMTYEKVVVADAVESALQFTANACVGLTNDISSLAGIRASLDNPQDYVLLPDVLSKEPLGPVVREGDAQWGDIVGWTLNALKAAEEFGITRANVNDMLASENPEIRRLLGVEGDLGAKFDLDADWARRAIAAVGNYGEVFANHLGVNTSVGLERGYNELWTNGGLMYSPPFR